MISLIFLAGSITNSERTVAVVLALGWIRSYSSLTLRSASAMIGNLTCTCCEKLMSSIHFWCDSTESTESAITLTSRLPNSCWSEAVGRSPVVHTGVKSAGCENSTPQLLPSHSWKRMRPRLDSCSKSGAVSPRRRLGMADPRSGARPLRADDRSRLDASVAWHAAEMTFSQQLMRGLYTGAAQLASPSDNRSP